jgi:2-polyprenyl-6-methoxyphenol hydroxylase-like FAD-dependent oxidoreductase
VAAFETTGYRPRDADVYVMYTQVGQQVARFTMRENRTMFLFVFAEGTAAEVSGESAQKRRLHERFGNAGWECPEILRALDAADDLYFDRVSQIRLPEWSRGRVALVGDAAYCVSLLAGQGSALAMAGAYVLAGELRRAGGDYREAFRNYEHRLAPMLSRKQDAAERFAGSFAPRSAFKLLVRNQASKLLSIPIVADWALGRDLMDPIPLPEYRQ